VATYQDVHKLTYVRGPSGIIVMLAEELNTDRQRRDALLWNFTVLAEATGQVSAQLKDRFPDVAWQQPMRLRNRIVHGYWFIDLEVLHTTATEQLPAFAAGLRGVLSTLTDGA
jgi:uncharacterized protein with HEPN domain